MPLESFLPKIDDRTYDDILAELRTRIPRYTPEWTDFNDSDPGLTLAQVFAWLTDMTLFRLGRVPEQNYIKFLQLIGIELQPAEPAQADISFQVQAKYSDPTVIIPLRTQVTAQATDGGSPIVFETERAMVALRARLASVQAHSGGDYSDVTDANTEASLGFEPFGPLATADSALMLGLESGDAIPETDLSLAVWASEEPKAAYRCDLPQTAFYPPADITWEFWDGKQWSAMNLLKDETRALTRSGYIFLKTPPKNRLQKAVIGEVAKARYWIRARLSRAGYERPPRLQAIRANTVAARQAETRRDEVLGGSDARPNQTLTLAHTPVLAGTLRLEVDEGDGFQVWTQVDDFYGSSPADRHYMLNRTTGEAHFGDGEHGAIPVANADNPTANIVAREYRFGGGKRGNVGAGTLKSLAISIPGIDENETKNLRPAHSGRDEESLAEAKQRAPRALKSQCRAVTPEDFETLARQAANVKRAKALPLFHPDYPDTQVPGVVTVIVVPDSPDSNPMPSEGTLRTVCAYLNQRRLLTTEVYVIRPTYKRVYVTVDLIAENDADLAEIKTGVEQNLITYFHPLEGGEDGQGWPFGGDIFYSRVYQRIFTQPGVQRIEQMVIAVDDEEAGACQDVSIPAGALVYSTGHQVRVSYSFDE